MSTANVTAFFELAASDPALRQKLADLSPTSLDEVIRLATESGMAFTADDLAAVQAGSELSEQDLSTVSGGVSEGPTMSAINKWLFKKPPAI